MQVGSLLEERSGGGRVIKKSKIKNSDEAKKYDLPPVHRPSQVRGLFGSVASLGCRFY